MFKNYKKKVRIVLVHPKQVDINPTINYMH